MMLLAITQEDTRDLRAQQRICSCVADSGEWKTETTRTAALVRKDIYPSPPPCPPPASPIQNSFQERTDSAVA